MDKLTLNDYQQQAAQTAVYPDEIALAYTALGLTGEAGEIANKVKKVYRDSGGQLTPDKRDELASELGDVLWYLAMLASELDISLETVAQANLDKLSSRQARGKIQGSGDQR